MSIPNLPILAYDANLAPNPENRFECVFLRLKAKQVDDDNVEFKINLTFGKHRCPSNVMPLSFALNGGILLLDVAGAVFEHPDDAPGQLPREVAKTRTRGSSVEDQTSRKTARKLGGKIAAASEATGAWEDEYQSGRKDTTTIGDSAAYAAAQILPLDGDPPGWRIRNEMTTPYLEGSFLGKVQGTCAMTGGPVQLSATFKVSQEDIVWLDNGWRALLPLPCRLKEKMIRRALFKRLIERDGTPYLSCAIVNGAP